MFAALTEPLDRLAIRLASQTVPLAPRSHSADRGAKLLRHADLFATTPREDSLRLRFDGASRISFLSPWGDSPTEPRQRVPGRFYKLEGWRNRPTVLLIHGWNSESMYRNLFPWFAWRLNQLGANAAMFELPFHGSRKPPRETRRRNFISDDLAETVEAAQQTICEIRALMNLFRREQFAHVRLGLWGFSLGGWLTGLALEHGAPADFAALTTPIIRMDMAIKDLAFCRAISGAAAGLTQEVQSLNLTVRQPTVAPGEILLVAAAHDLFAPWSTVEELQNLWKDQAEVWRIQHGHISILMDPFVQNRTARWLAKHGHATD